MLQLTSSGGSYPKETLPGFFLAIGPYLPMTYAVAALRDIISGNQLNINYIYLMFIVGIVALLLLTAFNKWFFTRDFSAVKEKYNNEILPKSPSFIRNLSSAQAKWVKQFNIGYNFPQASQNKIGKYISTKTAWLNPLKRRIYQRYAWFVQKINRMKRP